MSARSDTKPDRTGGPITVLRSYILWHVTVWPSSPSEEVQLLAARIYRLFKLLLGKIPSLVVCFVAETNTINRQFTVYKYT